MHSHTLFGDYSEEKKFTTATRSFLDHQPRDHFRCIMQFCDTDDQQALRSNVAKSIYLNVQKIPDETVQINDAFVKKSILHALTKTRCRIIAGNGHTQRETTYNYLKLVTDNKGNIRLQFYADLYENPALICAMLADPGFCQLIAKTHPHELKPTPRNSSTTRVVNGLILGSVGFLSTALACALITPLAVLQSIVLTAFCFLCTLSFSDHIYLFPLILPFVLPASIFYSTYQAASIGSQSTLSWGIVNDFIINSFATLYGWFFGEHGFCDEYKPIAENSWEIAQKKLPKKTLGDIADDYRSKHLKDLPTAKIEAINAPIQPPRH